MVVTKEDFADWKNNPVTMAFFLACSQRVEEAKDILALQAGQDSIQDSFYRGIIFAYREMTDFRVEDEEEV